MHCIISLINNSFYSSPSVQACWISDLIFCSFISWTNPVSNTRIMIRSCQIDDILKPQSCEWKILPGGPDTCLQIRIVLTMVLDSNHACEEIVAGYACERCCLKRYLCLRVTRYNGLIDSEKMYNVNVFPGAAAMRR
jgi:hypothetical protein